MALTLGDVLRITAKMEYEGNDIQNVFHVLNYGGTATYGDVWDALAGAIDTSYTRIDDVCPDTLDFTTIAIWNITQDEPVMEDDWPTITVGLSTSEINPLQLAGLALFGTSTARSQGRKYMPPSVTTLIGEAGDIGSSAYNAYVLWALDFLDTVIEGDAIFGFGNWNPATLKFSQWTSSTVQSKYRTQRDRFPGEGS